MTTCLTKVSEQITYTIDHICFGGLTEEELNRAIKTLRMLRSVQLEQYAIKALDRHYKCKNDLSA